MNEICLFFFNSPVNLSYVNLVARLVKKKKIKMSSKEISLFPTEWSNK